MFTHEISKRDSKNNFYNQILIFYSWFAQDGRVDCGPTSSQSNCRLFPSGITIRISFGHRGVELADHGWQAWNLQTQLRFNPHKTSSARKLASPNLIHVQKTYYWTASACITVYNYTKCSWSNKYVGYLLRTTWVLF